MLALRAIVVVALGTILGCTTTVRSYGAGSGRFPQADAEVVYVDVTGEVAEDPDAETQEEPAPKK
ncbi:MAG: hypothetical protein AAF394_00240 [Planctomycetota bacterium]